MEFDLDRRAAALSVGELAEFSVGPRDSGTGQAGLWRAQLGTHWHQQLRTQATAARPDALFEIPVVAQVAHRGWILTLTGRIDQILPARNGGPRVVREIKSVLRSLPDDALRLRADYPAYFAQVSAYLSLQRINAPDEAVTGELVFVEPGNGLTQVIAITREDESLFTVRLEAVVAFLEQRWQARERLRGLRYRPAFATWRPGQETTLADLETALRDHPRVAFEAPTGFGKTGLLLECALGQLKRGRFSRLLFLTGKSTGQLQVIRTLQTMTAPATPDDSDPRPGTPGDPARRELAVWQVRPKSEHCVNTIFHCVSALCPYLDGAADRWPQSGLARFYRLDGPPHDVETLRQAGREAVICPYEITRTALAFNDVWVGDYNYVFAPRNRGIFYEQPGFDPGQTLLIIDEAHNLPARVADAYSHTARALAAQAVLPALEEADASTPLIRAWTAWTELLMALPASDSLDPATEDDLADTVQRVADQLTSASLDYATLPADTASQLWETSELAEWLRDPRLQKLVWCPREGEVRFTCLDASAAIRETLQPYGGVVLASATFGPLDAFGESLGIRPELVIAHTPWRAGAYRVAYDLSVDTTFKQRDRHASSTARAIERLHAASGQAVVVFFPSFRYAELIAQTLDRENSPLRVSLQPRGAGSSDTWIEESLLLADALFLILGSSFAESIDTLGGRIRHALVVGPALPEVNAVQRARSAALENPGAAGDAFRRVYQIPGMQKVNQALGRLVRAPGQKAHVVLHCRRFGEASYAALLAPDYQFGETLRSPQDLEDWLRAE